MPAETATAAREAACRLARRLGKTLLAPIIRPGCSDHHLAFPGSLSIPREVFIETVMGCVRSLAPHGFDTFVLLSTHGGNFDALEDAARRLRGQLDGWVEEGGALYTSDQAFDVVGLAQIDLYPLRRVGAGAPDRLWVAIDRLRGR